MKGNSVIQVKNLQKEFGSKMVVQNISFNVQRGEVFGLLGPNGAGKTTILKMMTTLLRQDAGTVVLNGFDTLTQGRQVRQQFSLTGQTAAIDQDLSARENLMIFGKLNGLSQKGAVVRTEELLRDFDLINSADQKLATFSGGMRRRLDLAVSLLGKPTILFLDEPTTGLDPRTRTQMWRAIQKLVRQGSTVLLTTQYLEEADHLADHIALIDHGKMQAIGTPNELKQRVGGRQLRLEVADLQQVAPAKKIIYDIFNLSAQLNDRTLRVPIGNTNLQIITQVLDRFQNNDISITNFGVETPSLDDVFLKMTVGKN